MAAASGICRQRLAGVAPMLCADVEQAAAVALQLSRARADQSLARAVGVGNASAAASSSWARTSSGGYTKACANIVAGSTRGGPCNRSSLRSVISGAGSTTVGAFNRKSSAIKASFCTSVWFDPHGTPYFHGLGTTTVASVFELGPGRVLIPCQKLLLPYNPIISQGGVLVTPSTLVEADFASDHLNLGPLLYASQLVPTSKPMVVEMVRASQFTVNESMQSHYKTVYFPVSAGTSSKVPGNFHNAAAHKGGGYFALWDGTYLEGLGTCAKGPNSAMACLNLDGVLVTPPGFGTFATCMKAIKKCDEKLVLLIKMWIKGVLNAEVANQSSRRSRPNFERVGFVVETIVKWVCFAYPIVAGGILCYTMGISPPEAWDFAMMHHEENADKYSLLITQYRLRRQVKATKLAERKKEEEAEKARKSLDALVNAQQLADKLRNEEAKAIEQNDNARELALEVCEKARKGRHIADRARENNESAKLKCESERAEYEKKRTALVAETAAIEAKVDEIMRKSKENQQRLEAVLAKEAEEETKAAKAEAELELRLKKSEETHRRLQSALVKKAEEDAKAKAEEEALIQLEREVEELEKSNAALKAKREEAKAGTQTWGSWVRSFFSRS